MKNKLQHLIKAVLLLTIYCSQNTAFAQAPQKMSYQAVIRNASNALVTNASVGMRVSVLQGTATGAPVYVETQTVTTNTNGLVTLEIGTGTVVSGTFSTISWGTNSYYIKTETDPTGGSNYTIVGTSQLASVPYALFAANGGGASTNSWTVSGTNISNNNTGNVGIGEATPTEKLQINGSAKIGDAVWDSASDDRVLKFGDGDFTSVGEVGGDDTMEVKGNRITLRTSFGNTTIPNGNVGIGDIGPLNNKLQIGNPPNFGGNDIAIGNGTQAMSLYQSPTASTFYTNTNFAFMPASGTGNVGIGTDLPTSKLQVNGSVSTAAKFVTTLNYTPTADDYALLIDMNFDLNKVVTITLPNPTTCLGRIYNIIALRLGYCNNTLCWFNKDSDFYGNYTLVPGPGTLGQVNIYDHLNNPITYLYTQRNNYGGSIDYTVYSRRKSIEVQSVNGNWYVIVDNYLQDIYPTE
jgi:hypothetical protein